MMSDKYLRLSSSSPQTPPWWPEAQVVWLLNQIDGGYWVHRDLFVFYKMFVFDKKFVFYKMFVFYKILEVYGPYGPDF